MVSLRIFKPKPKDPSPSILTTPFSAYDPVTGLPQTINIGQMDLDLSPLVTIPDVKDHLVVLSAFYELRQSATSYEELCYESALDYAYWAQVTILSPGSGSSEITSLPSLGVLMCWHAHMLNPRVFDRECEGAYNALKDRTFPLHQAVKAIHSSTLPQSPPRPQGWIPNTTMWTPKEVGEAVTRQGKFVGNMSEIGWLKDGFTEGMEGEVCVKRGIVRYHAWLDLMRAHDSKHFLVPTLDIDLAWHTHQLSGSTYKADTIKVLGEFLDHNDNAGEGRLGDGLGLTSKLWKERFGFEYSY